MGSQEVWDSGIVCRRKEANREALDGGTSFSPIFLDVTR